MSTTLPPLDPLLHQPARTQLVAYLSGRGEASGGARAQTVYRLTDTGRSALSEYVAHLSALMALSAGGEVACALNLVADAMP